MFDCSFYATLQLQVQKPTEIQRPTNSMRYKGWCWWERASEKQHGKCTYGNKTGHRHKIIEVFQCLLSTQSVFVRNKLTQKKREKEERERTQKPDSYWQVNNMLGKVTISLWKKNSSSRLYDIIYTFLLPWYKSKSIWISNSTERIKTGISPGRNQNCDLYRPDLKPHHWRLQFCFLLGESPILICTGRIWNPTRSWFQPWHIYIQACGHNLKRVCLFPVTKHTEV